MELSWDASNVNLDGVLRPLHGVGVKEVGHAASVEGVGLF